MTLPLKLEYRVGVQAPPELIWSFVFDIAGWPAWNPLYPKAAGEVRFGSVLDLEEAFPGLAPRRIQPTVQDWTPNEQIIWRRAAFGGLLRMTRYIETERLSETGCIFSNGELYDGPVMRLIGRRRRRAIKAGFVAFGDAVAARAEADFRAAGGSAT